VTLNSAYFRLLGLPEASFGLIGAGIALLGVAVAWLATALDRRSPIFNFTVLCCCAWRDWAARRWCCPTDWA